MPRTMGKAHEAKRIRTEERRAAALFVPGERVALLPHTDWFMMGARYGTVLGSFRHFVRIELDTRPDEVKFVYPSSIERVD